MVEDRVRRALDVYYAGLRSMDVEQFVAAFAEDAVVYHPVGFPPYLTNDTRREFYNRLVAIFAAVSVEPDQIIITGDEAAVKWTARGATRGGGSLLLGGIDIVTINDAGKVQHLRSYWDPEDFTAQTNA
jgi:steroid Delta-isomerase